MQISDDFLAEYKRFVRNHKRAKRIVNVAVQALLTIRETTKDEDIRKFSGSKINEIMLIMKETLDDR